MPATNNKFVKWDHKIHAVSERCEGTIVSGQCINVKMPNTNYCPIHGGPKSIQSTDLAAKRTYRLQRWQNRVGEMADNGNIKSLREEVAILRMILEEMLNSCKDSMDLLMYSQRMSDLVIKIEKLVTSCDRLENRMGLLLSKDSVLQLAATYVQIINNYVIDPEVIEKISEEMVSATTTFEGNLGD
jgi:hypothetical protein